MEQTSIDRRSVAIGVTGLAIIQALLGSVFWIGFRVGDAQDASAHSVAEATAEHVEPASATSREDPCSPTYTEPAVCMLRARFDSDGMLVVDLEYRNVDRSGVGFDGLHAHLFPSDLAVESVGVAGGASTGEGEWTVTDATTVSVNVSDQEYLARTGEVCVATAGREHTLQHLDASCALIGA